MAPLTLNTFISRALKIRWLLILSWLCSIAALACAIFLFTSGNLVKHPDDATVLKYNVSSFGIAHYYNATSPYHEVVRTLVPDEDEEPLTIARYLGLPDWYSVSYRWICRGKYLYNSEINSTSADQDGTLSEVATDTQCNATSIIGNKFSLHQHVFDDLEFVVKPLANDIPNKEYRTKAWGSTWLVGIILTCLGVVLLPFSFVRMSTWGRGAWSMISTLCTMVAFILFLAISCDQSQSFIAENGQLHQYAIGTYKFAALTIFMILFHSCAIGLGVVGWGVGAWLEDSMPLKDTTSIDTDHPDSMRRVSQPIGEDSPMFEVDLEGR